MSVLNYVVRLTISLPETQKILSTGIIEVLSSEELYLSSLDETNL